MLQQDAQVFSKFLREETNPDESEREKMDAPIGKFEGTWKVTRGTNVGEQFTIRKKEEDKYEIVESSTSLTLDPVAFTLQNERTCISLFQDPKRLFGVEKITVGFTVWSAIRAEGGTQDQKQLDPNEPNWRLEEDWEVRARTGGVPVTHDGKLKIQESTGGLSTYLLFHNEIFIDHLVLSPDNRTLNSNFKRTVALWNRAGALNLIFAMVTAPAGLVSEDQLSDIEAIKSALEKRGGYLPFEIEMLAWDLAMHRNLNETSIGVWGAEEG